MDHFSEDCFSTGRTKPKQPKEVGWLPISAPLPVARWERGVVRARGAQARLEDAALEGAQAVGEPRDNFGVLKPQAS